MEPRKSVNPLNTKQTLDIVRCCWCSWVSRQPVVLRHRSRREDGTDDTTMVLLEDDVAETFRSSVTWLGFLALDRPDVQYAAEEAARGMRQCVRYLIYALTLTWLWQRQRWPGMIVVTGDTDWVGCPLTRRSTSGGSTCG